MVGCGEASAHGLPITGINTVNISCVTCFENKVYKTKKRFQSCSLFLRSNFEFLITSEIPSSFQMVQILASTLFSNQRLL